MFEKKHIGFTSLIKYASEKFKVIPDWRQENKTNYSLHDITMSAFACMYFKDPSLEQFQKRMQQVEDRSNLQTLFHVDKIPANTQLREAIDNIDSEYLRPLFKNFYARLQRGKHLEQYQIFPSKYYFPIDGSEFFSSKIINCDKCLTKTSKNGSTTYSHQVLQGGIMHPGCSEVIPFMPEQIVNSDGTDKQDCEMNAAKRYISSLRAEFPKLGFIIGGDSLFSRQPLINLVLSKGMDYIFVAKPEDHKYLTEWVNAYTTLPSITFVDNKKRTHFYEWVNDVPLFGAKDSIHVNYFRCAITATDKKGKEYIAYRNSWVTNLIIDTNNIETMVAAGRCRWKVENEVFNVMKNHGYDMEHSYGHGEHHLSFNFYLLTLLAFFMHQIFELTSTVYKKCRVKFGSKRHLWDTLRSYIKIIVFDSWDLLLEFALEPKKFKIETHAASP
jgi:hypothetical protein